MQSEFVIMKHQLSDLFEENRDLRQVIDSVHARYAKRELDLDEMDTVAAAGMPVKPESLEKQEK